MMWKWKKTTTCQRVNPIHRTRTMRTTSNQKTHLFVSVSTSFYPIIRYFLCSDDVLSSVLSAVCIAWSSVRLNTVDSLIKLREARIYDDRQTNVHTCDNDLSRFGETDEIFAQLPLYICKFFIQHPENQTPQSYSV